MDESVNDQKKAQIIAGDMQNLLDKGGFKTSAGQSLKIQMTNTRVVHSMVQKESYYYKYKGESRGQ